MAYSPLALSDLDDVIMAYEDRNVAMIRHLEMKRTTYKETNIICRCYFPERHECKKIDIIQSESARHCCLLISKSEQLAVDWQGLHDLGSKELIVTLLIAHLCKYSHQP